MEILTDDLIKVAHQWRLIANSADPSFASKYGYLADGQCVSNLQRSCLTGKPYN